MTALPHPLPFGFAQESLGGMGATTIWLACGATDLRKGFDGLAMLVQHCGHQIMLAASARISN